MTVLSAVPRVRVRFIRAVNNETVSSDGLRATPTVSSITVPSQHGYSDLRPVVSRADPQDPRIGFVDLVCTDDPDVVENFGWTVEFLESDRPSRTVAVPQSGTGVVTITVDGAPMPSVWLDQLASFSGPSGPTGSDTATTAYVDTALDQHEAAPDPHPQYAVEAEIAPRLMPSGSGWNQGTVTLGGYHLWVDDSGRLRIKDGIPTSATDGVVVGTQS